MVYTSSRSSTCSLASSAEAVLRGIGPDGGLYTPVDIPRMVEGMLDTLTGGDYVQRAHRVLAPFFDDFASDFLYQAIETAYGADRFSDPKVAPLRHLTDTQAILELWHGPTCAFKDIALQLLPQLMSHAAQLALENRKILILVATSGDTGKAALEGFRDVPRTQVVAFYPSDGVSAVQRLQMVTQQGGNVHVFGVLGNFDDAQSGVKRLFVDDEFNSELTDAGWVFSSANSINWGRLAPQIVYYVSAYCDAVSSGMIESGDKINFVVPSGNFGNILAAFYAMQMGLPINRLICAANVNNVLADFLNTGVYDRRRVLYRTSSPSMDILVSSNLERLLFEVSGHDSSLICSLMTALQERGWYRVSGQILDRLRAAFWAGWCDESTVVDTIHRTWSNLRYVLDPHTAVGQAVYEQYVSSTGDRTFTVLVSTASPFKFPRAVAAAIAGQEIDGSQSELELLDSLEQVTGLPVPEPLKGIGKLLPRHMREVNVDEIPEAVRSTLHADL